jgi:hypothetical protein
MNQSFDSVKASLASQKWCEMKATLMVSIGQAALCSFYEFNEGSVTNR